MPFQFRKEAIEEDLNTNFPSQGQGNPPLYYSLSEVVVPTYSVNQVAEGSSLPQNLQIAWDFSTGSSTVSNTTTTLINNTGFWLIDWNANASAAGACYLEINDGLGGKRFWNFLFDNDDQLLNNQQTVVFLRSGDSLVGVSTSASVDLRVAWRQIATLNGTLVNPLGFSAA